ncbi:hypothetical protein PT308_03145 [Metamycoplasma hyosynoviae]|uniref:putative cysteine peptidase n=2 Tax=Metamycoplasma hyosynoviae TaxID=29559 RepID=UPI002360A962|nr:hypothetical protein [Metamycoplasma hyosynoviae]MDD1377956.1 hypothetical protein [Metamycoplasma hyosynoviae]
MYINPTEIEEFKKNSSYKNIFTKKTDFQKILNNTKIPLKKIIEYCELEIFKYNKETSYRIETIIYCEDEYKNPYIYVEFNPYGNLLMSLVNNETILINPLDTKKIVKNLDLNQEYVFDIMAYKFIPKLDVVNNSIQKVSRNHIASNKETNSRLEILKNNYIDINKVLTNNKSLLQKLKKKTVENKSIKNNSLVPLAMKKYEEPEISRKRMIFADKELKHSWWFKGLRDGFGYTYPREWDSNADPNYGLCHFIGASILLQYSQLFFTSETLTQNQLSKYSEEPYLYSNWRDEYGYAATTTFNKYLPRDMWVDYNKKFYTTHIDMSNIINKFLTEGGRENPLKIQTAIWGSMRPWKWIDENIPIMIMGNDLNYGYHAVMPYGYYQYENKYLVHYGWEERSQVIMSTSFLHATWLVGISPKKQSNEKRYVYYKGRKMTLEDYEEYIVKKFYFYPFGDYGGSY